MTTFTVIAHQMLTGLWSLLAGWSTAFGPVALVLFALAVVAVVAYGLRASEPDYLAPWSERAPGELPEVER